MSLFWILLLIISDLVNITKLFNNCFVFKKNNFKFDSRKNLKLKSNKNEETNFN
jgi:hypothetical protein